MGITSLPPGFRFHPTDVELVKYYLKKKVMGKKLSCDVIAEVDIYKNEPWDLPDKSILKTRDLKWYFFCPRERKYSTGARFNRSTARGYWKTTGKDRPVLQNGKPVGVIKTLIFHQGRAPHGDRTDWVMHEYKLEDKDLADAGVVQDAFVLCMIFRKEGPGPRNGAQYGAPFQEDEWSDDEEVNCGGQALSAAQPEPLLVVPGSQSTSVVTGMPVSESMCCASASVPGQPETIPSAKKLPPIAENDDILSMLDIFVEDPTGNQESEMLKNSNQDRNPECAARSDEDDLFDGLGDLENWFGLKGGVPLTSCDITPADYSLDQMFAANVPFIELTDLETPLSNPSEATSSRYGASKGHTSARTSRF